MADRESDRFIVPEKPTKADGGKGTALYRPAHEAGIRQELINMLKAKLDRISIYSTSNRRIENLAHLITVESMAEIHKKMDKKKAAGVDRITKECGLLLE